MRVTVQLTPGAAVSSRASAVIVDILRATTTLTVALANGAAGVIPVALPEEAFAARDRSAGALLCGEREGRRIPGFDLGNSPAEYSAERVAGRTLIFASTNGSVAMIAARHARRRLLGAFVNLSAVIDALAGDTEATVICSGKLGRFSLEDAAFAGMLCDRLAARGAGIEGAPARLARALAPRDPVEVRALVEGSSHGRYLRTLGEDFARDVEFSAGVDRLERVFGI